MTSKSLFGALIAIGGVIPQAGAEVMHYGDPNMLGVGMYTSDPTAGATLQGLAPGAVTTASVKFTHVYPTGPKPGAYAGTDRVYGGGEAPTGIIDGFSQLPHLEQGPNVIRMDYGTLVGPDEEVETLTLGIAASDIQQPYLGQPYTVKVNGLVNDALTNQFNTMDLGGPSIQFFSTGIDPTLLLPDHILDLSIERAGMATDGWAVDFTTVGVTTVPVPEPTTLAILGLGAASWVVRRSRRDRRRSVTA